MARVDLGKAVAVDGTILRANSDRNGARTAAGLQKKLEKQESRFAETMAEMDALDAEEADSQRKTNSMMAASAATHGTGEARRREEGRRYEHPARRVDGTPGVETSAPSLRSFVLFVVLLFRVSIL